MEQCIRSIKVETLQVVLLERLVKMLIRRVEEASETCLEEVVVLLESCQSQVLLNGVKTRKLRPLLRMLLAMKVPNKKLWSSLTS